MFKNNIKTSTTNKVFYEYKSIILKLIIGSVVL